jgi:hypothetical protein
MRKETEGKFKVISEVIKNKKHAVREKSSGRRRKYRNHSRGGSEADKTRCDA